MFVSALCVTDTGLVACPSRIVGPLDGSVTFAEVFDKFVSKNIGGDVSSHRLVSCSISGSDGKSHAVDNFHDTPVAVMATFLCTSVKFLITAGTPATNVTSAFDTMMARMLAS